ncbi:hypothetical protein [Tardiphaga robiniae]|uniref:Uncharacterized protein n=1 Tax=Tardiphaga robiniae TaxID=943830 RepID=A0A164A5S7_9BRAD|nr:hypothetical protein [Tardiphaga robiniae]KZD24287.1 hypothetical protein A4A58_22625 [Tardiphaga robiniae]
MNTCRAAGGRSRAPPQDKTITFHDGSFRNFPELRWAWSNIRQLPAFDPLLPTMKGASEP